MTTVPGPTVQAANIDQYKRDLRKSPVFVERLVFWCLEMNVYVFSKKCSRFLEVSVDVFLLLPCLLLLVCLKDVCQLFNVSPLFCASWRYMWFHENSRGGLLVV